MALDLGGLWLRHQPDHPQARRCACGWVKTVNGHDLEERVEALWAGRTNATRICDFDEDSLSLIQEMAAKPGTGSVDDSPKLDRLPDRYEPREYQRDAIKAWQAQGYKGILVKAMQVA